MNDTLIEGAEEEIYEEIDKANAKYNLSLERSLETYVEFLISAYKKHGTLGHMA